MLMISEITCIIDLDLPERNLLGAIDTACWRKTWFSDSKFESFSSSLIQKDQMPSNQLRKTKTSDEFL